MGLRNEIKASDVVQTEDDNNLLWLTRYTCASVSEDAVEASSDLVEEISERNLRFKFASLSLSKIASFIV